MTSRRITLYNSVKYVSKIDHSHSEQTPPFSKEKKKNASNNKIPQKKKNFFKNISGEGFRFIIG